MSKIIKILAPLFILFIVTIGVIYMQNSSKKEHYLNVQEKRIDLFFKENAKNYKNVKITNSYTDSMEAFVIEGHINNNKKMDFDVTITSETNNQFDDMISYPKEIRQLLKSSKTKFPSEIIKEKHLDKEDYEADPPLFF